MAEKVFLLLAQQPNGTYQRENHNRTEMLDFLSAMRRAVEQGTLVPGEVFTITVDEVEE